MTERLFLDERNLQEMGFSQPNIFTMRKLTEFLNTIARVGTAETAIVSLDAGKADAGAIGLSGLTMVENRLLGSNGGTAVENLTLSEALDLIGSAAQGDILYRGTSSWARLGAGTSGHFLKTLGTGANPTWAAAAAALRGALVRKSVDQTTANYTGGVFVTWDTEEYDTDSIHDTSTNTSRLTVPSGVTRARLMGQIYVSSSTAASLNNLQTFKNGAFTFNGTGGHLNTVAGFTSANLQVFTPPLIVTAGDYFELGFTITGDASITIEAEWSWFAMEILV